MKEKIHKQRWRKSRKEKQRIYVMRISEIDLRDKERGVKERKNKDRKKKFKKKREKAYTKREKTIIHDCQSVTVRTPIDQSDLFTKSKSTNSSTQYLNSYIFSMISPFPFLQLFQFSLNIHNCSCHDIIRL